MKINNLYEYWAKAGFITAIFLLIMLFFNSRVPIGSFEWFYWFSIPLYMFHQFEEYVFPGGFKEELNQILGKAQPNQEILTNKLVLTVNIGFVWILNLALILLSAISVIFPIILMTIVGFNGIVHVLSSIRFRKYNPGLVLSIVGNIPLSLYVLIGLGITGNASSIDLTIGIVIGVILHALLFVVLITRAKRKVT